MEWLCHATGWHPYANVIVAFSKPIGCVVFLRLNSLDIHHEVRGQCFFCIPEYCYYEFLRWLTELWVMALLVSRDDRRMFIATVIFVVISQTDVFNIMAVLAVTRAKAKQSKGRPWLCFCLQISHCLNPSWFMSPADFRCWISHLYPFVRYVSTSLSPSLGKIIGQTRLILSNSREQNGDCCHGINQCGEDQFPDRTLRVRSQPCGLRTPLDKSSQPGFHGPAKLNYLI